MSMKLVRFASVVSVLSLLTGSASAATSGSQVLTVIVPTNISIVAPTAATLTHDQTDNPQAFPTQNWVVRGNSNAGVNVSFATANPFVHSTLPAFKRDAKLNLAVGTTQGPAAWTVGVAQDQTNYLLNDGIASVTATSTGVGRANLSLSVTFVTEEFGVFAAGDYSTTVTGTVAAN